MSDKPIRICVATSYGATQEPRGAALCGGACEDEPAVSGDVHRLRCAGQDACAFAEFRGIGNVTWKNWMFPWRGGGRVRLAAEKIRHYVH